MAQFNQMSVKSQLRTDKYAATLSFICVLHCLLAPSFFILTSGFFAFSIDNEFVHNFILFLAIPKDFNKKIKINLINDLIKTLVVIIMAKRRPLLF